MNSSIYRKLRAVTSLLLVLLFQSVGLCQQLKPEEVYQKALPSIATLVVEKKDGSQCIGNAFLGLKDGLAITAWHVVRGAKHVTAKFSDGEEFEVSGVVDRDEKRDVAVVKVKVFGRPTLVLNPAYPAVGSKAYVIGAPKGLEFSISEGLVSQIQTVDGVKYLQFSCPASPGSSGGPLANAKGEVTGVVSWQVRDGQNLNFAVPSSYVVGLDTTLPTQPWNTLKEDTPTKSQEVTSVQGTHKILAEALICAVDAGTAVAGVGDLLKKPVYSEKTNFWTRRKSRKWLLATPVYLFQCQRDVEARVEALTALVGLPQEAPESKFRDQLLRVLKAYGETLQGLADTIKTVERQSGWTAEGQDEYGKAIAAIPRDPIDRSVLKQLGKSKEFCDAIPEDVKVGLGLSKAEDRFPLSVRFFSANPLMFIVVMEGGLAQKLGFRDNDLVERFAGETPETLLELKGLIEANLGKEVEAVVRRDGKDQRLKIRIPEKLAAKK